MKIVDKVITLEELKKMAEGMFGNLVKAVVEACCANLLLTERSNLGWFGVLLCHPELVSGSHCKF